MLVPTARESIATGEEAEKCVQEATGDPGVVGARFDAALEQIQAHPRVDSEKIAAIGYCFGGAVMLGMVRGGADFRVVRYPGVKHSFTNPEADDRGMQALAYDAEADEKSWQAMLALFLVRVPPSALRWTHGVEILGSALRYGLALAWLLFEPAPGVGTAGSGLSTGLPPDSVPTRIGDEPHELVRKSPGHPDRRHAGAGP